MGGATSSYPGPGRQPLIIVNFKFTEKKQIIPKGLTKGYLFISGEHLSGPDSEIDQLPRNNNFLDDLLSFKKLQHTFNSLCFIE